MTLTDLERWDAKGQTFLVDLRNYAPTVLPRTIKIAVVTLVGMVTLQVRGVGANHPVFGCCGRRL